MTELLATFTEARQRFMDLVAEVRPELHRYCARMTGSVFDGEDVVQETLAKAYYALAEMESPPPLRPWLFRIAHNTALDFLRRYEHRNVDAVTDREGVAEMTEAPEPAERGPDGERVEAALQVFAALPPVQRSKDLERRSDGHQHRGGEGRAGARASECRQGQCAGPGPGR